MQNSTWLNKHWLWTLKSIITVTSESLCLPGFKTKLSMLAFVFLCRLLCRLTYALCLNFLAVIHLDGHVTGEAEPVETSFTKVRMIHLSCATPYQVVGVGWERVRKGWGGWVGGNTNPELNSSKFLNVKWNKKDYSNMIYHKDSSDFECGSSQPTLLVTERFR